MLKTCLKGKVWLGNASLLLTGNFGVSLHYIAKPDFFLISRLEAEASEKEDKTLHFSDSTVGWENTLHQLQSSDTIAFGSSRQIVDKLDPDAPHYQKRNLHDLDADDEQRLNRYIFEQIRCGKLDEAEKVGHQY